MTTPDKLITKEFLALNSLVFLTFCNLAVFFHFHQYLRTLPIDPEWFGFLIGVFSLAVVIIRPIISPLLHPGNAKRWIVLGSCTVIASLVVYNFAHSLWAMAAVRIVHGAGYVVLATAVVTRLVASMPPARSGQAFAVLSILTILPYAVIPPLLGPLERMTGGFDHVLDLGAVLMLFIYPILMLIKDEPRDMQDDSGRRIGLGELKENLKDHRIWLLLLSGLMLWSSFTPVFYYLAGHARQIGVANAGLFFTLSTLTEIALRLVAGSLFDKLDKTRLLAGSLAWLAVGCVALAYVPGPTAFYGLAIVFGLGWGVAMPVLSGLTFDVSAPRFRALNTNLSMEMFQAGFFLGPMAGGLVLDRWGNASVYLVCAAFLIVGLLLVVPLLINRGETQNERWRECSG